MVVDKKSEDVVTYDRDGTVGQNGSCGEGELQQPSVVRECDEEDRGVQELDDVDLGAESDGIGLLELGDVGAEICLVDDQTCSIPLELYDLPDLSDVLSLDVWNDCLSEEDRFSLAKYLPDMDEATYMWTLKDLLSGNDFHFGSPVHRLFKMMKGGLCEPRVALYRQCLKMLQKCKHYHLIRNHHNNMVSSFNQISDVWGRCRGYSIEEKLQKLNVMRSQRTLTYEKMEDMGLERASPGRDDHEEDIWSQTLMETKVRQKKGSQFGYEATCSHSSRNQKQKALLKLVEPMSFSKQPAGCRPSVQCGSSSSVSRHDKMARCETNSFMGERKEAEEVIYTAVRQRDKDVSIRNHSGIHKSGTGHGRLRKHEFSDPNVEDIPLLLNDDKFVNDDSHQVNRLSDIKVLTSKPSGGGAFYDFGKKLNYFGSIHSYTGEYNTSGKGKKRFPQSGPLDSRVDMLDPSELFWQSNQPEVFMRKQFAQVKWDAQIKRPQMRRDSLDLNMNSYLASLSQTNDEAPLSNHQAQFSAEHMGGNCVQNGAPDMTALRGIRSISPSDETESDSSKNVDEQSNPLRNRGSNSGDFHHKNSETLMTKKKSKKGDLGEEGHPQIAKIYSFKGKQKSSVSKINHVKNTSFGASEEERVFEKSASNKKDSKRKKSILGKTRNLLEEFGERLTALESYSVNQEHKADSEYDASGTLWKHLNKYEVDEHDLLQTDELADCRKEQRRSEIEIQPGYERAKSNILIPSSSGAAKKRKRKENGIGMEPQSECDHLPSDFRQKVNALLVPKQEYVGETETGSQVLETLDPQYTEVELMDVELEAKPKKIPYILITPTVHTDFPFSVVHLLSAVRITMITQQPEDPVVVSQPPDKGIPQVVDSAENQETATDVSCNENAENSNSVPQVHANVPSLTIQEIVNRVRSNPGDPCILETQEPLQDLVKGVLKIFSSKKAPLGAKDWKPLAAYKKSTRSWYWTGSISQSSSSDQETLEEVTSPEAWGIPRKMLVKLVDSFANWLKSSQEFLQQLGSLPAPPESLFQFSLEEKDRFKDQRAQRSACTFEQSCAEVRDYFRQEEALRYSIPDRVFAYTAADGSKSLVAPLRRCGGKPTSKPRDHFLLKPDRPPHVTILCLVRDAAARLPGCVGTRSDICTLMRDSQYIVEDVPDAQLNQIVSGALDRLHYEHDPCVHFHNDRKIWVYLHRERTEEDFEDDGTSSTRRWKRQKKDHPVQLPDKGTTSITAAADQDADERMGLDTVKVAAAAAAADQDADGPTGLEKTDYNIDEEDIIVDIM